MEFFYFRGQNIWRHWRCNYFLSTVPLWLVHYYTVICFYTISWPCKQCHHARPRGYHHICYLCDIIFYVDKLVSVKWLISLLLPGLWLWLGRKEVCVLRPSINLYHYPWGVKRWNAAVFSALDILLSTSFLFSCNRDNEHKRFLLRSCCQI